MKKKLFMLTLVSTVSLFGCSNSSTSPNVSLPKTAPLNEENHNHNSNNAENFDVIPYSTMESLIKEADIAVEIVVSDKGIQRTQQYMGVDFTLSSVIIKDVIIGNSALKNTEITLIETGLDRNVVKKNEKYIVFLKRSQSPINPDAFAPVGMFQGKFRVKNDGKVEYEGKKFGDNNPVKNELETKSIFEVKEEIKQEKIKYSS